MHPAFTALSCGCLALHLLTSPGVSLRIRKVVPPQRPIVNPPKVEAEKAEVHSNELVLGIALKGKAMAYPLNQLTGPTREIINDELGKEPIIATW